MLNKKLFIQILIVFILNLVFSNNLYATYNISSEKINELVNNWYFLSSSYTSEQQCIDKINEYNRTVGFYIRSECFNNNNKFYYLKCDKTENCSLNYILNQNTNNFSQVYLFRTYNNRTGKYYLKYSNTKSISSIVTHDWEYVDWISILSNDHVSWTTAIYLWGNWADWYITYNTTSNLLWYAWENPWDWRIAIYNCYRWNDYYISNDISCNGNNRYNNSVFYMYPEEINKNINYWVIADSYVTLKDNLTIIAHTELPIENISFCVTWKSCVRLSEKWEEYKIFGLNKKAGYKITIMSVPAWVYEWYFKYVSADWKLRKSNIFRQIVKKSLDWNVTITWKQKAKVTFSVPEWFYPKFYINFNSWEFNLVDEWWLIRNSGWINTYTQNLSLLFRWVYNSYVIFWNNKLNLNSVTIK